MHHKTAFIALFILLILVNGFILGKEKHLSEGRIVYLELAPVDPRSFMQGDYMALRFRLANEVDNALPKKIRRGHFRRDLDASDGHVVVRLDERNIGSFKQLYRDGVLPEDEILMRYRVRRGRVKFATNAFFFQEGHGKYYEKARYGQFRVDDRGELLLTAMYDKDLNRLAPL